MCDYSLQAIKSRPAKVADKLTTKNFGTGTTGFCASGDDKVVVCVLPGTELAFADAVKVQSIFSLFPKIFDHKTAIFRQISKNTPHAHHDCLEFPNGETTLLTRLIEGQSATVLQLPAAPKTEAEAEAQRRVDVTA